MSREAASNSVIRTSPLSARGEGGRPSWHEVGGRARLAGDGGQTARIGQPLGRKT